MDLYSICVVLGINGKRNDVGTEMRKAMMSWREGPKGVDSTTGKPVQSRELPNPEQMRKIILRGLPAESAKPPPAPDSDATQLENEEEEEEEEEEWYDVEGVEKEARLQPVAEEDFDMEIFEFYITKLLPIATG